MWIGICILLTIVGILILVVLSIRYSINDSNEIKTTETVKKTIVNKVIISDYYYHNVFGYCKLVSSSETYLVLEFKNGVVKNISKSYKNLFPITETQYENETFFIEDKRIETPSSYDTRGLLSYVGKCYVNHYGIEFAIYDIQDEFLEVINSKGEYLTILPKAVDRMTLINRDIDQKLVPFSWARSETDYYLIIDIDREESSVLLASNGFDIDVYNINFLKLLKPVNEHDVLQQFDYCKYENNIYVVSSIHSGSIEIFSPKTKERKHIKRNNAQKIDYKDIDYSVIDDELNDIERDFICSLEMKLYAFEDLNNQAKKLFQNTSIDCSEEEYLSYLLSLRYMIIDGEFVYHKRFSSVYEALLYEAFTQKKHILLSRFNKKYQYELKKLLSKNYFVPFDNEYFHTIYSLSLNDVYLNDFKRFNSKINDLISREEFVCSKCIISKIKDVITDFFGDEINKVVDSSRKDLKRITIGESTFYLFKTGNNLIECKRNLFITIFKRFTNNISADCDDFRIYLNDSYGCELEYDDLVKVLKEISCDEFYFRDELDKIYLDKNECMKEIYNG